MSELPMLRLSVIVFRVGCSDELYTILKHYGPFDGGCHEVAEALRRILGGTIVGVWGWNTNGYCGCQHAVLQLENSLLIDASGIKSADEMCEHWRVVEHVRNTHIAPMPDVLWDASYDEAKIEKLEALFRKELHGLIPEQPDVQR